MTIPIRGAYLEIPRIHADIMIPVLSKFHISMAALHAMATCVLHKFLINCPFLSVHMHLDFPFDINYVCSIYVYRR